MEIKSTDAQTSRNQVGGAVVIMSGGLDSTVLLHYVKAFEEIQEVYGLSFNYGQRHFKELRFAKYWGDKLCKEHKILNIDFMAKIGDISALLDHDKEIPTEHYTHENQQITVVPNRNMIMLSIAVGWAENLGITQVYFGPHANDETIYPDCREPFVDALSLATALGTYNKVEVFAPFVRVSKGQVVKFGFSLGVDFQNTWSCYKGEELHCGECATCQERIEAFQEVGVIDPTEYVRKKSNG